MSLNVFLEVGYHACVGFSIGLQRLVMSLLGKNKRYSWLSPCLAFVRLVGVGYRRLFSSCVDVAGFVYGEVGYGE